MSQNCHSTRATGLGGGRSNHGEQGAPCTSISEGKTVASGRYIVHVILDEIQLIETETRYCDFAVSIRVFNLLSTIVTKQVTKMVAYVKESEAIDLTHIYLLLMQASAP